MFFAQSVSIKLPLPHAQAAQLSKFYYLRENKYLCNSVWDQGAQLIDKDSTEKEREEKQAQQPIGV